MSHQRYYIFLFFFIFFKCNPPGRSVTVPSDSFFPFSKGELDTKNQRQYRNVPGNMMNNTRGAIRVMPLIMATSVWLQKPFSTNKCEERCTSGHVEPLISDINRWKLLTPQNTDQHILRVDCFDINMKCAFHSWLSLPLHTVLHSHNGKWHDLICPKTWYMHSKQTDPQDREQQLGLAVKHGAQYREGSGDSLEAFPKGCNGGAPLNLAVFYRAQCWGCAPEKAVNSRDRWLTWPLKYKWNILASRLAWNTADRFHTVALVSQRPPRLWQLPQLVIRILDWVDGLTDQSS